MTADEARTAPPVEGACYVYGVVPEPEDRAPALDLPGVGDPEAQATFVRHRGIAAVVSAVPTDRPLGTPEDLHAHARVLDSLAASTAAVVPFRFGTVLPDVRTVVDELLEEGRDDFTEILERLDGQAQFTLRARYVQDAVLREVLGENPKIARLREEVAARDEAAGYYQRVELGRAITDAIADKRNSDTVEIQRRLAPFAVATATAEPTVAEGVVNASFLVPQAKWAAFEKAAEELAAQWHGRIHLRLLGPLAPYDFVDEAASQIEEGG
ncbi:gas vesicle protein GvpL/GvpF [Streptomyces sp. SLBN-118]|uniref:GvpL/GvpF family gas vesicle protein n=1 Tax=Streptomyces sp. SLBN-118 TaxID=2768454 RepID=UPI00117194E1|nr:GvpL/GvpF family gas vesicle protein [Streptomyces sp. SLBN-118]TQK42648.1 gas vesicle protein GvpL/GvpF [Streptomyces sp. SLBN-118]